MMHERGTSGSVIVALKLANKAERSAAELVERRAGTKGNVGQQSRHQTQSWTARVTGAGTHTAGCRHTRGGSRMRESRTYGSVRGGAR